MHSTSVGDFYCFITRVLSPTRSYRPLPFSFPLESVETDDDDNRVSGIRLVPVQYRLPFVIGYPLAVLVHRRINHRSHANARLDACQLPVAPQAASESPFLLQKHNHQVIVIVISNVIECMFIIVTMFPKCPWRKMNGG